MASDFYISELQVGLSKRQKEISEEQSWQREDFYFGNGGSPSYASYRTMGERIQRLYEYSLTPARDTPEAKWDERCKLKEVLGFFANLDSLALVNDAYCGSAILQGWKELDTPEAIEGYKRDKSKRWV